MTTTRTVVDVVADGLVRVVRRGKRAGWDWYWRATLQTRLRVIAITA